jgi:lipoprotein-anchoring transpeptidase ErfK/SrfK
MNAISFPSRGLVASSFQAVLIAGLIMISEVGAAWEMVDFPETAPPGWIIINARERALFYVIGEGTALRYPIAVPKKGKGWSGKASVSGKYVRPAWSPPPDVRVDHPELPDLIPGGRADNPMGARAITLDRFQVAIHGTTWKMRRSIGTAASYGCIRMLDEDIVDLFDRISIGTPVLMVR